MGTIVLENTIIIARDRSEVHAFCVGPKYRHEVAGLERLTPAFGECVRGLGGPTHAA